MDTMCPVQVLPAKGMPHDPCPERAAALLALETLGAPSAALDAARTVDIVAGGLTPLDWVRIALWGHQRGSAPTWGWQALSE